MRTSNLVLFAALAAAVPAQKGMHVDATCGIKLKPPDKWGMLPAFGDRGATLAMWASPKSYDPKVDSGGPHVPMLRLMFFPTAAGAAKEATAEKTESGLPKRTPYASFDDYLARGHGGRIRITSKDDGKVGKLDGRNYVLSVARSAGDLVLETGVVRTPAGDVALEFEVLADWHERLGKDFKKTFATVDETLIEAAQPEPAPAWEADYAAWRKLPAEERAKQRREYGQQFFTRAKAVREPGWTTVAGKSFVLLSRAESKLTKRILPVAEAARAWVDKRFGALGDEVVMPAVVRVFASAEEYDAWQTRNLLEPPRDKPEPNWYPQTIAYHPRTREILYWADPGMGNTGEGFGPLLIGVLEQYLDDKDPHVIRNMPRWLASGLTQYLINTRCRGDSIAFEGGTVETERMRYHERGNSLPKIWNIVQETASGDPDYSADERPWGWAPESCRVVRFVEAGNSRAFGVDDMLVSYLRTVGVQAAAAPPDPTADVDLHALDDKQREALDRAFRKRRDALLKAINGAVVPMSVDQWQKADQAFVEWNAKFK
jgi:hypothetical protein